MPLYEYECKSCKKRFEQLVFNKEIAVACPSCRSGDIAQLLSVFSVAGASEKTALDAGPCGSCGAAQRGTCGMN